MAEKERTKFFSRGPTSSGLIQENSTFIKMKELIHWKKLVLPTLDVWVF